MIYKITRPPQELLGLIEASTPQQARDIYCKEHPAVYRDSLKVRKLSLREAAYYGKD
jgi:hypothetical protein